VAQFLGSPKINLLAYQWDGVSLELRVGSEKLRLDQDTANALQGQLAKGSHLAIRPEFMAVTSAEHGLPGVIEFLENLGDVLVVYVQVEGMAEPVRIKVRPDALKSEVGQRVGLLPDWTGVCTFTPDGQRIS
jgi:ABC-type sugar transport system ATPase subunit